MGFLARNFTFGSLSPLSSVQLPKLTEHYAKLVNKVEDIPQELKETKTELKAG